MIKRKKKKDAQKNLMTVLIVVVLLFAMFLGYFIAKQIAENKIKKQAGPYVYSLKDSLELVCAHVEKTDPYIKVNYIYYVDCYYTSEKSDYKMSRITINNNGKILGIVYRLSVDTAKSKEENYEEINSIMRDTTDAIKASKFKEKSFVLNHASSLPKEFIIKIDNSSFEKNISFNERINNDYLGLNYYSQNDEDPHIPPYMYISIE